MPNSTSADQLSTSQSDLEWIGVQKDINATSLDEKETTGARFQRKVKQNPLVPIGCMATATVLVLGLRSLAKGNRVLSQKMMRYRVAAQGLTLAAIMLGVFAAGKSG